MILRSLEVANFRKFRDPLRVDGFTDGLNIVVEPNETGKSTLLEALRAAFFIRHSAKTELVRSYVPIGDDVAPRVTVEFMVNGQPWTLEKQFMKSTSVRLTGSGGRRESDAAEDALQELLGFERGNNRGSDSEARGPLGMLWVEQASAFAVESPNRIVRDTVHGVLEAEVGAVTGGRRFDAIRTNIEMAYGALRTPATRKSRGDLSAAESRLAAATLARQEAEGAFREYEQSLNELDSAKARLRLVERDLADPDSAEERRKLEADQKVAETASLRSAAAEAQHGHADEVAKAATARIERLDAAELRVGEAAHELVIRQKAKDKAQADIDAAAADEKMLRSTLNDARKAREAKEKDLSDARGRMRVFTAAAGARRAIDARQALADLEARERVLQEDAALALDEDALDDIAQLEREEVAALARFEAGTVKVDVELSGGALLRIDGEASTVTSVDVLAVTRFEIGDAGTVVVRPPQGSDRSIEADLAAACEQLADRLRALGIASHAAGVARNERAASAARELKALRAQISAASPGDPTIGLAAGADALRAFVAGLGETAADAAAPDDDLDALEAAVTDARLAEVATAAKHEEGRVALSKAERAIATLTADLAAAVRESDAAGQSLETVLKDGDRASLEAAFAAAQRDRAAKLELLGQARAGAKAFDLDAIKRRIENLDRAASRAGDERLELTGRIASLEATIAREGAVGPAGRAAEAREEELAAVAACERLRHEADTLEMLRQALADAANEASRTFLAPVTRRAARYVERLLPGCGLSFGEGLELTGLSRAGVDESCGDLSRGTQEQLAILTRLAFADLLLEDGAPISLILDDPLVYSDDARLETMTDILQEAAQRMQVILLTCRSKAFRHVDGNRIVLP
ncbi:AAA family ATPase [Sphingomonas psychrotolerans]|uniref:AAA family ATPase n=1 Tax=Sphingomonas psychrotolerans TaxID=1327635 RepID=UPI00130539E0|nr:AAA family ATPase [Sphingomonas psychrotolerans]